MPPAAATTTPAAGLGDVGPGKLNREREACVHEEAGGKRGSSRPAADLSEVW